MTEQNLANFNLNAFLTTLWGKVLAVLAACTLFFGVTAELFSIYRSWQDSQIAANQIYKSKAEQCSARSKNLIDSVPMNQLGPAMEALARDCDPNYAARTKCDEQYEKILHNFERDWDNGTTNTALFDKNITDFKAKCPITDATRNATAAMLARIKAKTSR